MSDPVSPRHYRKVAKCAHCAEPIDLIQFTETLPFCEGNVVKYVTRWRQKDGLQDLLKARWYLQRLIETASSGSEYDSEGGS